jgi:hypothetical protein
VKIQRLIAFALTLTFGFALRLAAQENSAAESLRPKKFILSVGVGQFQSNLWHPLRYARKDATDIYNYFIKAPGQNFDGGVLVTDNEQPVSAANIIKAFERLKQDNRNEEDTVVVYVSTHGTVAYKEDGKVGRYIITSDTDPQNTKKTALDYDYLMEMFQQLKSRKKVLILAFCHSGVGKSILTPEMKRALAQLKAPYFEEPIQERSEGSIVLTASGWREPALEDERLQNDVYTHFLLEGFGRDRNGDGAVSITEAHAFASQATYEYTKGRQRPSAIMELLGSDPVIVSGSLKKKDKGASLFSLMDRFSKLVVSIDGKDYGSISKGLTVPEGDVRLTLKDPDSQKVLADRVVNFQAGREYSVANYLLPRLPNSLSVGLRNYQFLNRDVNQGYTPNPAQGMNLRYVREEAFWLYDLVTEFSYFPEQDEKIEVDGYPNQRFEQKRSMMAAMIGAQRRLTLSSLSSTDRSVRTEARWLAGINSVLLNRVIDDRDSGAFDQQEKLVATGGLSLGTGLDTMWVYHLIRAGAEVRLDLVRNFTVEKTNVLMAPTAAVYVGTFW